MNAPPVVVQEVQQCASGIAPEAVLALTQVESQFDPLALNVNRVGRIRVSSVAQGVAVATRWISAGYSVDLGIAQINSRNLKWTGLTLAQAFEPCANLAAAAKILSADFAVASRDATGMEAIGRTFSMYNTGSQAAGYRNNYVAKVWASASRLVSPAPGVDLEALASAARGSRSGGIQPSGKVYGDWVVGVSDTPDVSVFK